MSAREEIIRRLSEDSLGGIATLHDVTTAEELVDAHAAEVLAAVDKRLEAERMQPRHGDIFRHGIEHARKAVAQMADGPEPALPTCVNCRDTGGPFAPTGRRYPSGAQVLECAGGCEEKATAPAATATPFFQPGHTYTRDHHGETAEFDVRSLDTHPDHGGPVAFGWYRKRPRTAWHPYSSDDFFDGWREAAVTLNSLKGGA